MELKQFKCVKDVHASPMTRGEYNEYRGWTIPANEQADEAGYLVVYNKDTPDHYESWSPKRIFDAGYVEMPGHGLPDYQRRVLLEKAELDDKTEKLTAFINSQAFYSLPEQSQYLLPIQLDAMRHYQFALERRIDGFGVVI